MDCITVAEVKYLGEYRVWLKFNTGESGEMDLKDLVFRIPSAAPLKDVNEFAKLHLDSWPTVVWDCGFDLDPDYLYERITGNHVFEKDAISNAS